MRCRVSFGVVLSIVGTTLAVHAVCRETFAQPAPTAVAAFPDLEPAGVTASVDPVAQLLDDDPTEAATTRCSMTTPTPRLSIG